MEKRPGLWSSLAELPAHTRTVHVCTGTEGSVPAQRSTGNLCGDGPSVQFVPPTPPRRPPELPPPLGCLRLTPLFSPNITSSVRSSSLKDERKHCSSFLLLLGGWIEGNINGLTNLLKVERGAGVEKTLKMRCKLIISINHPAADYYVIYRPCRGAAEQGD